MTQEKQNTHIDHRRRLRDRFARSGMDGLADYEVVELLLTLVIPRRDVKPAAKELIQRFGNLRSILDADPVDLAQVPGIGSVTPVAVRLVREMANLYLQQKAEYGDSLADPRALHDFWRARIGSLPNEVFQVAYLDSAYRLLRNGVSTLAEGTTDRSAVYPRRVIEAALRRKASALVFAHNHTNGHLQPSEQDKAITRALVLAATTVNIKVLDHLIIAPDAVFSFRKEGLL
jgi:DNA repair protein RadC